MDNAVASTRQSPTHMTIYTSNRLNIQRNDNTRIRNPRNQSRNLKRSQLLVDRPPSGINPEMI